MSQTDLLQPAAACMAYITAGSYAEATTIARTLVNERLAACVNILGPSTSVYTWEGRMEETQEFVLIAKTRRSLFTRLSARVKTLNSYDTPCIVSYAMDNGFPPFMAWIKDVTDPT